jgi:hypothetical protein
VISSVSESQPRARDQILHCARHENLARPGQGRYTGPDVDCKAAVIVIIRDLAFAGVNARADVYSE